MAFVFFSFVVNESQYNLLPYVLFVKRNRNKQNNNNNNNNDNNNNNNNNNNYTS